MIAAIITLSMVIGFTIGHLVDRKTESDDLRWKVGLTIVGYWTGYGIIMLDLIK